MVRAWERGMPATMFVVLLAVVVAEVHGGTPPPYKEYYMQQTVDHFNYQNQDVFEERYLLVGEYMAWRGYVHLSSTYACRVRRVSSRSIMPLGYREQSRSVNRVPTAI